MKQIAPSFVSLAMAALLSLTALCECTGRDAAAASVVYEIVVTNGRVIDPESGLDGVRHLGIVDGRIAKISESVLEGRQTIDATGRIVAPGFIDLHAHGQDERSARLQAQDGVTTALDMEAGVFPVPAWYKAREGKALIHFGASAGHRAARVRLKHGIDIGHEPTDHAHPEVVAGSKRAWRDEAASPEEIERLAQLLDGAFDEGALGLGLMLEYTPGARRDEIFHMFALAARRTATVFVHTRSTGVGGLDAFQEVLADAAASGAPLHILHVTSSGLQNTPLILKMIEGARNKGLDVSVEAYPYTAASTRLASAYFDGDWQRRLGISYDDLQWPATGERLTEATFEKYRQQSGYVIIHMIPEAIANLAIEHPLVMIASDGIPFETGGEHPRGAGTFSRVLGHYVRDRGRLSLTQALRKMTLMPAERLERFVPQMRNKGRLREGADADITIFDAATIVDRATYEQPMQPSAGVVHVIVGGTFVVKNGKVVEGVFPGRAIRNEARPDAR